MGEIRNNQYGFSAVETALVLVIVGLIGFVGWYVWHSNKKADDTLSSANKTAQTNTPVRAKPATTVSYTDDSKTYTLTYPKAWTIDSLKWNGGSGHSIEAVQNSFVQLDPPDAPKMNSLSDSQVNGVTVIARNSGDINAVLEDQLGAQANGQPFKPEELKINGNKALKQTVTKDNYTDENYFVTNGKVTLVFFFRAQQTADGDAPAFDSTGSLDEYAAIVKSVKFLN